MGDVGPGTGLSEGEAFFGHRGAGDVAAQAFELVAFAGFGRDTGMQGEAGNVARAGGERFVEAAAFEVILELALDILWQRCAVRGHPVSERGVVRVDELVEESVFSGRWRS